MKLEKLSAVLVAPLVSEKAARATEQGHYLFEINPLATKVDVKQAVEAMFKVQVTSVQVSRLPAKKKQFRGFAGKRSGMKKAYVKLKPGFTIDFGLAA